MVQRANSLPVAQAVGAPPLSFSREFLATNKNYYLASEDYDWVEVTDTWKGLEALFHKLRERKVRQLVAKHGGPGRYLDAGCGTALNLRHLPPGAVGVDINPRNLPRARHWAPEAGLVHSDLERLPFAEGSFDTIVCTEVLEHFPIPILPLAELVRVLAKNGVLIGSVPATSWIWRLRFLSSTCPQEEPYHKNYTRWELESLLGGFKVLTLEPACFGMNWMFAAQKG